MPRTSHQARIGEPAGRAIARALNEHRGGRGGRGPALSDGYDPTQGPLADKAEAFFEADLEEPDDLAFEGAKVSRDPETGRFIRAPAVEDAGISPDGFTLTGGGSDLQQRAVEAGFRRAARAKGWRVDP